MTRATDGAGEPRAMPFEAAALQRALRRWFRGHARDLPWRKTRDPYAIWVSEVMLQQTQVATVVPYYQRFLARFPHVAELARAEEADVLRYWEGLGYYRRARQLHQAARQIVREHQGAFPSDYAAARELPGVGRYTAGAVLSMAFEQRLPILEANSTRVLARWLAFDEDVAGSLGQRVLWGAAAELLPRAGVGEWNQALMELGATVCLPREPRCDQCPVVRHCRARELGIEHRLPRLPRRPVSEAVHEASVVVWRRRRVLLRQCGPGERWAGLWDFPRFPLPGDGRGPLEQIQQGARTLTGAVIIPRAKLLTIKHGVTRFRITLDCYQADYRSGVRARADLRWLAVHELAAVPLSTTGRRIARHLEREFGQERAGARSAHRGGQGQGKPAG